MGRKAATLWHASFFIGAGVLYFFFVLPRWPELMGDTSHVSGTALRIVTGAIVGSAALPVVFTLMRTRKPELGTPQLALSIRIWSIVAHAVAGVLIAGTAISEIWLSLDTAGQWLFGIYGAAAAIAVLGFFTFYLSFVAELPPPPPKPLKSKELKQRRIRRKKRRKTDKPAVDTEDTEAEAGEPEDTGIEKPAEATTESPHEAEPKAIEEATPPAAAAAATAEQADEQEPQGGLRNRRPTGKTSHRRRRPRRGGVAVED